MRYWCHNVTMVIHNLIFDIYVPINDIGIFAVLIRDT